MIGILRTGGTLYPADCATSYQDSATVGQGHEGVFLDRNKIFQEITYHLKNRSVLSLTIHGVWKPRVRPARVTLLRLTEVAARSSLVRCRMAFQGISTSAYFKRWCTQLTSRRPCLIFILWSRCRVSI